MFHERYWYLGIEFSAYANGSYLRNGRPWQR